MSVPCLRAGLVGVGRWGAHLARCLTNSKRWSLVGVADPLPTKAAIELSCPHFESAERLIAGVRPEVLIIATPPLSHEGLVEFGLSAGCHVFVEKPVAFSEQAVDHLERLARREGRQVSVGHILRFVPAIARMARILREELGPVHEARSVRRGISPTTAEGAWWCLAPHDMSLAERWMGATAPRAEVVGERVSEGRVAMRSATLGLPLGEWSVEVEAGAPRPERSIRLQAARGSIQLDELSLVLTVGGSRPRVERIQSEVEPLVLQLEDLAMRLSSGRAVQNGFDPARGVTRMLEAVERVASARRQPRGVLAS